MIRILFIAIFTLSLGACTSGIPLKAVDYNNLLHDNNSKVWIVNKQFVNGVNISNGIENQKDVIVFHESGAVSLYPMKGLGTRSGKKGVYYLDSEKKTLEFVFQKGEHWVMDLKYITEDSVFMKHTKKSTVEFDVQIKPLPEFDI